MEKKLLIVDSAEAFCAGLEAALKEEFCILTADCGEKALEILDRFAPDVIVLDVMLPGMDGISVLRYAAQHGCKAKTLVMTSVRSDYIFAKLAQLEVSYVLMKPCRLEIAAEHVQALAAAFSESSMPAHNVAQSAAAILLELGLKPKHNGYHYLCSAIEHYATDSMQSLTKELYVAVGTAYGVSWQQVERSIRSALEAAWENRDESVWRRWFPAGTLSALKRPANGAVICRLAECLRLEQTRKLG